MDDAAYSQFSLSSNAADPHKIAMVKSGADETAVNAVRDAQSWCVHRTHGEEKKCGGFGLAESLTYYFFRILWAPLYGTAQDRKLYAVVMKVPLRLHQHIDQSPYEYLSFRRQ
ncbi:hypothetical protein PO883_32995 [Massilia sp. DJPM01]|uniref:hypothetical protein n=1 Tax=Massilia sp. DJPM01 TaxID=3024404 RepID=UPI00259DAD8D|nr:hypothetical protein [Massilia sp. DJPM01]MDM5181993.1 hypothetical protein [Massilia sp. DJPM01]